MNKRSVVTRRALCILLALALLLPLSGPAAVMTASAVTQAEIDDLKGEAAQLDHQAMDALSLTGYDAAGAVVWRSPQPDWSLYGWN